MPDEKAAKVRHMWDRATAMVRRKISKRRPVPGKLQSSHEDSIHFLGEETARLEELEADCERVRAMLHHAPKSLVLSRQDAISEHRFSASGKRRSSSGSRRTTSLHRLNSAPAVGGQCGAPLYMRASGKPAACGEDPSAPTAVLRSASMPAVRKQLAPGVPSCISNAAIIRRSCHGNSGARTESQSAPASSQPQKMAPAAATSSYRQPHDSRGSARTKYPLASKVERLIVPTANCVLEVPSFTK